MWAAIGTTRIAVRRLPLVAAIVAALAAGCAAADPTAAVVKRIIDELSTQQFGRATALYTEREEMVLSPPAAPAWRRGMDHEDATVREWSIDALSRIGLPEDVPRVVAALDDPFRRVQEAAAQGLIDMDPVAAHTAFIDRLSEGDAMQRTIAAQGLADLGDTEAVPALVGQLGDERLAAGLRGVIAQSLSRLGDVRAVEPLDALAGDSDADTQLRRTAVEALAGIDGEATVRALESLLEADDSYVQDVARRVLDALKR